MKCVCGYEYVESMTYKNGDSGYEVVKGDEPFIKTNTLVNYDAKVGFAYEDIVICPKCGTLKIDI